MLALYTINAGGAIGLRRGIGNENQGHNRHAGSVSFSYMGSKKREVCEVPSTSLPVAVPDPTQPVFQRSAPHPAPFPYTNEEEG